MNIAAQRSASIDLREERLVGLQSLRALAALAVVLQHTIYYVCVARGLDYMQYLQIGFGGLGVNVFFVISGFIMAGCTYQGRRFLWNRAVRIYPGYWLAIALSGVLLMAPAHGWFFTWKSLWLTPSPLNSSYHIPYWTLVYEMGFYVLVALLVALRWSAQAMSRFCVVWLLAVAVMSRYVDISIIEPGLWLWFAPHNVFFISGLLVGLNYRHLCNLPSLPLGLVAVVGCTFGETLHGASQITAFMFSALGFAAVVLLAIRHLKVRLLERMGDASYGIYLFHAPILVLCTHLMQRWFPGTPLLALFAVSMAVAVVGSTLYGLVEFRLHRRLRKVGR